MSRAEVTGGAETNVRPALTLPHEGHPTILGAEVRPVSPATAVFERRVLIVEDDAFVASLLATALAHEGFAVAVAHSAAEAKRRLAAFDPDLMLVDLDLGEGPTGIDLVTAVSRTRPEIAAIVLSKHPDHISAGAGARELPDTIAYLRKSLVHDTGALVQAIDEVVRGSAARWRHDRIDKGALDLLTSTQRETLHLMALGLSNAEIARRRGVSVSNVEQRVGEIFKALCIATDGTVVPRVEAVRRYIAAGALPLRAG